jgi:hypothetical protein
MYDDPMMAILLYRMDTKRAEENLDRGEKLHDRRRRSVARVSVRRRMRQFFSRMRTFSRRYVEYRGPRS